MIITTAGKIAAARLASRLIVGGRRLAGLGPELEARRGGVRWRLDLREGVDLSIYLLGGFEPATLRLYPALVPDGGVVLDVGANVGSHTLPLARLVGPRGRVHAVEPTAYAVAKLAANLRLNPDLAPRVSIHQALLGAAPGDAPAPFVYSSWPLEKAPDLHEKHLGRLMSTEGAAAATLDGLAGAADIVRLDLVKIDVDGAEPAIVAGAVETLRRLRPSLLLEMAPYLYRGREADLHGMFATLAGLGYRLVEAGSGRPLPADPVALSRAIPDGATVNVVARAA